MAMDWYHIYELVDDCRWIGRPKMDWWLLELNWYRISKLVEYWKLIAGLNAGLVNDANLLRDWSWIDIGLGMNGLSIDNGLEMDLCWIGTGLPMNWRRSGCGDWHVSGLAPYWDGLALDRHRIGDGLKSDRWWIDTRLALDWHQIGTGLDWTVLEWFDWCCIGPDPSGVSGTKSSSVETLR